MPTVSVPLNSRNRQGGCAAPIMMERGFRWISFKSSGPARAAFRSMRLSECLSAASSWQDLRSLIVEYNGRDDGRFVEAARRYDSRCSSGEGVLLHPILHVTDFAWLADELDDGRTWRRMDNASGEHRQAVAACIAAAI